MNTAKATPKKETTHELVHSFPRCKGEEIHVSISTHNGNKYIDIRQFYRTKHSSEWLPTKKGLIFSADSVDELKKAMEMIAEKLDSIKDN